MSLRSMLMKVGVCAVLLAGAAGAWAGTTKTITIDCAKGASINTALADKADTLVLEIRGTCVEDVVVRRHNVTLRGTSPAVDGIQAATPTNPIGAAVLVDDAGQIVIENLKISGGGRDGVTLQEAGPTTIRNSRIEGNLRFGVAAFNSVVTLEDLVVTGNGAPCSTGGPGGVGVLSFATSSLTCTRCTVTGNDGGESGCDIGVQAGGGSSATVRDSTVSGDPAVFSTTAARLFAIDSTLTGKSFAGECDEFAALSTQHGELSIQGGTIAGGLLVDLKSFLALRRSLATGLPAQQTQNNCGNGVTRDSMLDVAQGASLLGATNLDVFSQGFFRGGGAVGDLTCNGNSDAICRGGSVPTTSTCATCPAPPPPPPPLCAPTIGAEYVLSGGTDPAAAIFVDDTLRVFVEDVLVSEQSQGGHCCPPAPPVHFTADTGDSLRVQAQDANNCYSLDALWIQKTDGSCLTQLTGDISGPNCGSEPPGQVFFDQTFSLP